MKKVLILVAVLWAVPVGAMGADSVSLSTAAAVVYEPPAPPAHAQRNLESAADLSRDLADTVAYLESGQSYFRPFTKGTHTPAENKLFVGFLDQYEKESATAKNEVKVLRDWLEKAAGLK
ncbi:MAG: hypothetical protein WC881_04530 [Elusimicrobiota bacterium]|jgi:hypothetical protein